MENQIKALESQEATIKAAIESDKDHANAANRTKLSARRDRELKQVQAALANLRKQAPSAIIKVSPAPSPKP